MPSLLPCANPPSWPRWPSQPSRPASAGLDTSPSRKSLDLPSTPSLSLSLPHSTGDEYDSDGSSWSELTETGQWAVCAVSLASSPGPGLAQLAPETPPEACFPTTSSTPLALPSRPHSPVSSISDSDDSSEDAFDPMLGLLALASSTDLTDPKRLSFRSQRKHREGAVVGSLSLGGGRGGGGTNNGAYGDNAASDSRGRPDLSYAGLGGADGANGANGAGPHRLADFGVAGVGLAGTYAAYGARRSSAIPPMQPAGNSAERRRRSLPTLVLQTSSCTSLLLDHTLTPVFDSDSESESEGEDLLAQIPFDLSPLRSLDVDQTASPCPAPASPAHLARTPAQTTPVTPAPAPAPASVIPAARTDHAARTASSISTTSTAGRVTRPPNRRAATSPAEHDHSSSRDIRGGLGGMMKGDPNSTRIDSLFPPSSSSSHSKHGHGLGLGGLGGRRGRGPLSLFGLRRSLSVGHRSDASSSVGAKSSSPNSSSRDGDAPEGTGAVEGTDRGPEHIYPGISARSGSLSAHSAYSVHTTHSASDSARSSFDHHHNGYGAPGQAGRGDSAYATVGGLATPTPGERKLPAVPLPVTPTSAHGPHSPALSSPASPYCNASQASYATDPYPSSPLRFQRYHYLPSSSRASTASSPRSPSFPQHPHHVYDQLLNASDAASPGSTSASASPDPSSWHEHGAHGSGSGSGYPGAGATAGQVGPVLDAGHSGHSGHAGQKTAGDLGEAQPVTGSRWPVYIHESEGDDCGEFIFGHDGSEGPDAGDEVLSMLLATRGSRGGDNTRKGDREPTIQGSRGAMDGDASEGGQGRNAIHASRSVHPGTGPWESDHLGFIDARSDLGDLGGLHTATRIPPSSSNAELDRTTEEGTAAGNPTKPPAAPSLSHPAAYAAIPKDDDSPTLEPLSLPPNDHHSYHSCDLPLTSDPVQDHQVPLDPLSSTQPLQLQLQSLTLPSLDFSAPPPPTLSPAAPASPTAQVTAFAYHTYPTDAQTRQTTAVALHPLPDSKDAITLKSPPPPPIESPDPPSPDQHDQHDQHDHQDPESCDPPNPPIPLDKHTKTTSVPSVTAVGPPVLAVAPGLPIDVHDKVESTPSHPKMERWNPHLYSPRMFPPEHGHGHPTYVSNGTGNNSLGRKTSPRPSPLPSPAPSQGLSHDGSPLSPTTTSSASIHDTKSIKEKPKKKGGWFGRKNKDDDESESNQKSRDRCPEKPAAPRCG